MKLSYRKRLKVLAIDDSSATLSLIVDILSRQNYTVETAKGGEDGLAKYGQFKPDLVTLDLTMPGMDGYETLIQLKKMDPLVNIVMLTAADDSAVLKRCLQAGALDFVSKPFTPTELANTVLRAMDRKNNNRNVATFFTLLNNRFASTLGKTLPGISSELKDVLIIKNIDSKSSDHPESSDQAGSIFSAEDCLCFITPVTGERHQSMISSYVSANTLNLLLDGAFIKEKQIADKVLEFVNILNMKVVSELANATHMRLDAKPALFFSKPAAMTRFWNETARMWGRIAQGTFEIDYRGNRVSFGIRIWYEGELFA